MSPLAKIGVVPFDLSVLSSIYPHNRHINEKARLLEKQGAITRLKKGLYVANPQETGLPLNRNLIANHLYGPSYVSLNTAMRYYGLIPEHVYLTQSLTTKHARDFETKIGNFNFEHCSAEYFPIGITMQQEDGLSFLVASPEKALCDLINYSKSLNLRFVKDVEVYLEEDIRFYMEALPSFNISILENCMPFCRKAKSIEMLIKYIKKNV